MKNLISYDDFVNESASSSEWSIHHGKIPANGLLQAIPDDLQKSAQQFLKSLAKTPDELELVNDTISNPQEKYGPTLAIKGPIARAILPIYAYRGILRAGGVDRFSQPLFDALIETLKSFGK